jgi:hypothetical protein
MTIVVGYDGWAPVERPLLRAADAAGERTRSSS